MAKQPKKLSDADIVTRVSAKSKESVSWYDSKLSLERTRVLKYYNGDLPKRQHPGRSSYVSTDVYDSVEMMKAQILEVFAGGDEIAQFDPDEMMDEIACSAATAYCRKVIFHDNPGYHIFSDVIHDGLIARVGVAKVFWDEDCDYEDGEFSHVDEATVQGMAAHPEVDSLEAEQHPVTGLYSGKLKRKIDKSKVRIIVVPPEEFLVAPRSVSLAKAPYVGHRTLKTKAELKDEGYDTKIIDALHYDDNKGLDMSPEVIERTEQVESQYALDDPIQPSQEQVMVYESFVRMDIGDGNGTQLWRIVHVNDKLLEKEPVDKAPFLAFVPLPIPHMLFGNNYAAKVIPVQNARTVLTRGVLDHTSITVNPRYQVVNGGIVNPSELLENRLGGIVNVRRPDSVTPLQYSNLNPFVFQILGMLKDDKEQSTGISSLSQGLNKDAISKQNSTALVDQMVQLSGQRQKIIARNFAYGFFVPLMLEVVRLAILNDKGQTQVELGGQTVTVTPSQWTERTTCRVSMHLGYGDKEAAAAKLKMAYQGMAQDPAIADMFTRDNRYNMIIDAMKLEGMSGASRYITNPAKLPPPQKQPDPIAMAEAQAKSTQAQASMTAAQAAVMHEQNHVQDSQVKHALQNQKQQVDAANKQHDQLRKDLDVSNKINVSQREMRLAEHTAQREAFITPKAG